jgi:predicted regulator of Ras-like GTPase activity (Roadblock/LC7/MglB family)
MSEWLEPLVREVCAHNGDVLGALVVDASGRAQVPRSVDPTLAAAAIALAPALRDLLERTHGELGLGAFRAAAVEGDRGAFVLVDLDGDRCAIVIGAPEAPIGALRSEALWLAERAARSEAA